MADSQFFLDTYRVRWPLSIEGLAEITESGQQIKVTDIVEKKSVKIGSKTVNIQGLAQTLTGLVPISYLEPKCGQAYTAIEKKILEHNPIIDAVAQGQWWLGRVSPIEAGLKLSRNPGLIMGSYAVCQPPEMDPLTVGQWAEFMLVVRNISGDVDQWMYEWMIDNRFNQKFGKALKERQVGTDIIRGPPASAIPPIAYYIIKRTPDGMFYLESKDTFSSIDLLLSYYYSHILPLNGETHPAKQPFNLALQGVMHFDLPSHTFPRPVLGKMTSPDYLYKERSPMKLFLEERNKSLSDYKPRIAKKLLLSDSEQRESLFKAYLHYNGIYNPVTIRKLRPKLFNQKAFDKDIARLKEVEQTSKNSPSKLEKGNIRNGYGYLSHVVGFGFEEDVKFSHWIAYEFITGIPLDRCLQRRKHLSQEMSLRQKSEVLYQVCAGMRFLELNGLCHRHLRAANIIIYQSTSHMYAVKISDYMVPYHFLNESDKEDIELCDLDWPWFAPECLLHRKFNIVTDVWAFGCIIFELNHDGLGPYAFNDPRPQTLKDLQTVFEKGEKMAILNDEDSTTFLDELLFMCTKHAPDDRPTFDYMFKFFRELLFDFAVGPEPAIQQYIKNPKTPKESRSKTSKSSKKSKKRTSKNKSSRRSVKK